MGQKDFGFGKIVSSRCTALGYLHPRSARRPMTSRLTDSDTYT